MGTSGDIATEVLDALANRLLEAESNGRSLLPFTSEHPSLTLADAYEIQARVAVLKARSGRRHIGWKTAFTNPKLRERFQAREPTRGHVFEPALSSSRVALAAGPDFVVEPEVTFQLAAEVSGPDVIEATVLSATGGLCASLELARTRFKAGWKLEDITADNAAAAYMVVSRAVMTPADVGDLASIKVELQKNGEAVATGTGAEVLGDPA
jgi:2-keto-4-pentenoate hydratase